MANVEPLPGGAHDPTAVVLGHPLHQGQPEAEAAEVAGVRFVALGPLGERGVNLVLRHADARVAHGDLDDGRVRVGAPRTDDDPSPAGRELDGVVE